MKAYRTALLLALVTWASLLHAQEQDQAKVRLCAITVRGNIKGIQYQSGEDTFELDILRQLRSDYFKYSGKQVITFFRETGVGEKVTRTPVGSCKLPSKSGDFMLIFSKKNEEEESYRIIAIPDGLNSFKPGTYRFINLAAFPIGLQLDGKVHNIKESAFTDVTGNFQDGNYYEALMISSPKEAKPLKLFKGNILFSANRRVLYVVTPKEGGRPGRIQITTIQEKIVSEES